VRFSADLYRGQLTPDILADPSGALGEVGRPP
jgi:hypothetical protein